MSAEQVTLSKEVFDAVIAERDQIVRRNTAMIRTLRRIAAEPCNHAPGFCPRIIARDTLAEADPE